MFSIDKLLSIIFPEKGSWQPLDPTKISQQFFNYIVMIVYSRL